MKLFLFLGLFLSLGLSAKEIPTPKNVKTINNPTMNHIPFLAADGAMYLMEAQGMADSNVYIIGNANSLCRASGYIKAYSYIANEIQEDSTLVMAFSGNNDVIYERLTENVDGTNPSDNSPKVYRSTIFKQISCYTK
jgi:hypothetical protein